MILQVGKKVLIFMNNDKEVERLVGEKSIDEVEGELIEQ